MKLHQKILLIDTSSILHGAKHSAGKNITKSNQDNFVIFGFFLKLQYLLKRIYPDTIVFANDNIYSIRKETYPAYKEKRNSKKLERTEKEILFDDAAFKQFNQVKDHILPELGFRNIFNVDGLEADDIIGRICKDYKQHDIYIVTSDADMYQLLSKNICIFLPTKNKFFSEKDFKKQYGIEPKMWKRVKAMAGCMSDNVAGVPGVAEKTALRFITGDLPEHYKTYKTLTSREGKDIINRNKGLVILPHRKTPSFTIKPDHVSKRKLIEIATEYKLQAILRDIKTWSKLLNAK
jgi:DNA polymerase-1